ncbi:MAG: hypothetical protein AAGG00_18925 [Cyanobacteria bacterium P01_H01_bin.150]
MKNKPKDTAHKRQEDLYERIRKVTNFKEHLEKERQAIFASGCVAPPRCWIARYLAKGRKAYYWYYKLQATEPIFSKKSDGKPSRYKHLGKAGSKEYLDALEQINRRTKVEAVLPFSGDNQPGIKRFA